MEPWKFNNGRILQLDSSVSGITGSSQNSRHAFTDQLGG